MVGWRHQFNGHEFEQALGVGDGQGGLVCCSPWGLKDSDVTERLNCPELKEVQGCRKEMMLSVLEKENGRTVPQVSQHV